MLYVLVLRLPYGDNVLQFPNHVVTLVCVFVCPPCCRKGLFSALQSYSGLLLQLLDKRGAANGNEAAVQVPMAALTHWPATSLITTSPTMRLLTNT